MVIGFTLMVLLAVGPAPGMLPAEARSVHVAQVQPTGTPTLDSAVYLDASVDRNDVYLGESLTLSLEYWELNFRGLRVQPHIKSGRPVFPDTEGFYAGQVREEQRDATRGGLLYRVTTYRQELFPARAGTLRVGPWNWTGTVRGHTAAGAQSRDLDISTSPIEVQVRPLPEPPSTFSGAVGEFEITLEFESRELSRGVPEGLFIDVTGQGNPHTLQAPPVAPAPWFSVGAPKEEEVRLVEGGQGRFVKRFRYTFMPLGAGEFMFPPLALTYFSPAEGRYKVSRTAAVELTIEAGDLKDTLVVIGAGGGGAGPNMLVMDEGRLPLVAGVADFRLRRKQVNLGLLPILLPPLLFLVALALLRGPAALRWWSARTQHHDHVEARLAAAGSAARPLDSLDKVLREILSERLGRDLAALSVPEIRAYIASKLDGEGATAIAAVLQACAASRYGQRQADSADLIHRARLALSGLPPAPKWWGLTR